MGLFRKNKKEKNPELDAFNEIKDKLNKLTLDWEPMFATIKSADHEQLVADSERACLNLKRAYDIVRYIPFTTTSKLYVEKIAEELSKIESNYYKLEGRPSILSASERVFELAQKWTLNQ